MGAPTSKMYAFTKRPWEASYIISRDPFSIFHSLIRIDMVGADISRILPVSNNSGWISDLTRFSYDGFFRQRLTEIFCYGKKQSIDFLSSFVFFNKWWKYFENVVVGAGLGIVDFFYINKFAGYVNANVFYDWPLVINDFRSAFLAKLSFESKIVVYVNFNPRLYMPVLNLDFRKIANNDDVNFYSFGHLKNQLYSIQNIGSNIIDFYKFFFGICDSRFMRLVSQQKFVKFVYDPTIFENSNFMVLKALSKKLMDRVGLFVSFLPISLFAGLVSQLEIGSANIFTFNNMSNIRELDKYIFFFSENVTLNFDFYDFVEYIYYGSNFFAEFYPSGALPISAYPLEGYFEKDVIFYDVSGEISLGEAVTRFTESAIRSLSQVVQFLSNVFFLSVRVLGFDILNVWGDIQFFEFMDLDLIKVRLFNNLVISEIVPFTGLRVCIENKILQPIFNHFGSVNAVARASKAPALGVKRFEDQYIYIGLYIYFT